MIEGVKITSLRQIVDERGKIMHMLRADAPHFEKFGEIYFSFIHPGVIKGWHIHKKMTLNYAVPVGKIKLVLYDDRENSTTRGKLMEIFIGPDNYQLITIPPLVWNGTKGIAEKTSIIANCSTHPHDPNEIARLDPFDKKIPYDWSLKHG
ncbi:MAG: dTDP-4-dehydrorhamnose 3,5-epimerase family protein [Candidatus Brocadiaceae bacterium]|nr:dTDP-4-dehydrorhamnose 3,5-epimerase family protein [Candidatus Brocadiaceae bacterium]